MLEPTTHKSLAQLTSELCVCVCVALLALCADSLLRRRQQQHKQRTHNTLNSLGNRTQSKQIKCAHPTRQALPNNNHYSSKAAAAAASDICARCVFNLLFGCVLCESVAFSATKRPQAAKSLLKSAPRANFFPKLFLCSFISLLNTHTHKSSASFKTKLAHTQLARGQAAAAAAATSNATFTVTSPNELWLQRELH